MDELPSTEFRKRYATLAKETIVTVNGHIIGRWFPMGSTNEVGIGPDGEVRVERDFAKYGPTGEFNSRPFTPVPKPGKR